MLPSRIVIFCFTENDFKKF